jgi:hypothetical protein
MRFELIMINRFGRYRDALGSSRRKELAFTAVDFSVSSPFSLESLELTAAMKFSYGNDGRLPNHVVTVDSFCR